MCDCVRERRVWRRDPTGSTVGASPAVATDAPAVFPAFGYCSFLVFMNLTLGGGTLAITQKVRKGTAVTTASFTLAGAGFISQGVTRTAEIGGVSFANGATPQKPEILVTMK